MIRTIAGLLFFASVAGVFTAEANVPALIPKPQQMELHPGVFQLDGDTKIYASDDALPVARQLAGQLEAATGYALTARVKPPGNPASFHGMLLTTEAADPALGAEGYALDVTGHSVIIRAPTQAGLYYGTRTVLQLLPPEIFARSPVPGVTWQIPCGQIKDWPRFPWRGLMLDVSRHFYDKDETERIIDLMSLYKLNRLHLHLTDSQGWRIEIKKYPRLTQVGAWRKHADITLVNFKGVNAHPAWAKTAPSKFDADGRYGGFYTQDDIRALVAYAAERQVTIVPEIELPGHSGAALAAYPQYGGIVVSNATDLPLGLRGYPAYGVYNPANEQTFAFLDDILSEVMALFPGKYIHIGGDEVGKYYWSHDPECQALMQREGLDGSAELQSWFIKRIEKYVDAHGKTMIGWSEILQGGLAQNAVVMDWIGGARAAATAGHDVVMTPNSHCYLNYYQSTNRVAEPHAQGGYLPLQKVYAFEPIPTGLPVPYQAHILGAQGNLWTEWVASLPHVEYMLFPRLCALSEVDWSPKEARDWNDFQARLATDETRLDKLGVNYHHDSGINGGQ